MFKRVKVITNNTPAFLREADKHKDWIDFLTDDRSLARGERFIRFHEPSQSFDVFRKFDNNALVKICDNMTSAIFHARKNTP